MIFGETMNPVLKEKKFLVLAITVVVVVAGLALYLSSSSSAQSISPSIQARFAVLSTATSDQCAYLGNRGNNRLRL
jgi:Ni,Fe-hydrogenase I cytochrome b subunit